MLALTTDNTVSGLVPKTLGRQVAGTEEVFIEGLRDAIDDIRYVEGFIDDSMVEGFKDDSKDEGFTEGTKEEIFKDDTGNDGILDVTKGITVEQVFWGDEYKEDAVDFSETENFSKLYHFFPRMDGSKIV